MDVIQILKDWVIPLGSVGLAIWFASSARRDAERAEAVLSNVNKAVEGWQKQIMSSTVNILESLPQVVEGKTALARMEAAKVLIDGIQNTIREITQNPQMPGGAGHTQQEFIRAILEGLTKLLQSMEVRKGSQ